MKQKIYSAIFTFLFSICLVYGQKEITGKVSSASGEALPGVSINLKGTTKGNISDANGNYKITANSTDVLIFTFIGYESQEVLVGSQSTINVTMQESTNSLDAVFVTATTRPVRKIETITAVESIGAKELARINPVSLPDAIRFTPGVFIQTQAGRVRNFIFMRGFPDVVGNGLGYTSLLSDGLRTFASPEMVPDAAFRYDLNIERIEVVRGAAATLYGRGAAAGAVNVITKTGATEFNGVARYTYGQYGSNQVDLNVNGPINDSKTWRFNVGGFVLSDKGLRANPVPDEGGQLRGNIDWISPNDKGTIRFFGGVTNLNVYNNIDIPYKSNDFSKPALGYTSRDVMVNYNDFFGKSYTFAYPAQINESETVNFDDAIRKGNFSKGWNFGAKFDFKLGKGWTITENARYQDMLVGIGFDFGSSTTFGPSPANGTITQNRIMFGGGRTGGGSAAKDFINELRLNKNAKLGNSNHNITIGHYFSTINVKVASVGAFYSYNTPNRDERRLGAILTAVVNPLFRNGDYTEDVNSIFAGDEMKFGEKLTVNIGIRQDWIKMNLIENRFTYQKDATRKPEHSGLSASLGLNYLIDKNTALYANINRSYRAPDYGAYTTVRYAYIDKTDPLRTPRELNPNAANYPKDPSNVITTDEQGRTLYMNPYIDDNEIITSFEGGFRKSVGGFSFDGGVFYNTIKNRLVSTFVGALAVSVPGGDNKIVGTELSATYSKKGFFARTSLTLQDAEYTRLIQEVSTTRKVDVKGNKTAQVPRSIWNVTLGYETSKWGVNFNNNYLGERPADPHNIINYPAYSLMDGNIYVNFPTKDQNNVRFKISSYNLLNNQSAGNIISAVTDNYLLLAKENGYAGTFSYVRGVPILPRRFSASVEISF